MTESLNDVLKVKALRVCSIWNEKLNTCLFRKVSFIFYDKTNVDELTARFISQNIFARKKSANVVTILFLADSF